MQREYHTSLPANLLHMERQTRLQSQAATKNKSNELDGGDLLRLVSPQEKSKLSVRCYGASIFCMLSNICGCEEESYGYKSAQLISKQILLQSVEFYVQFYYFCSIVVYYFCFFPLCCRLLLLLLPQRLSFSCSAVFNLLIYFFV